MTKTTFGATKRGDRQFTCGNQTSIATEKRRRLEEEIQDGRWQKQTKEDYHR